MSEAPVKTEAQLRKEAEKAAKLAKFQEKQKKLEETKAIAASKPKDVCSSLFVTVVSGFF